MRYGPPCIWDITFSARSFIVTIGNTFLNVWKFIFLSSFAFVINSLSRNEWSTLFNQTVCENWCISLSNCGLRFLNFNSRFHILNTHFNYSSLEFGCSILTIWFLKMHYAHRLTLSISVLLGCCHLRNSYWVNAWWNIAIHIYSWTHSPATSLDILTRIIERYIISHICILAGQKDSFVSLLCYCIGIGCSSLVMPFFTSVESIWRFANSFISFYI